MQNRDKRSYSRASTSLAYTVSNISAVISNIYKRVYPEKFFNYTHITTKTALAEIKNSMNKKNVDFVKHRPILLVEPNLDFTYEGSMDKTRYGERMYQNHGEVRRKYMKSVLSDKELGIDLEYIYNEYKMTVKFDTILETYNQMLNIFNLVKNGMRIGQPHYLDIKTDSILPKQFINEIAVRSGIEIGTQEFFEYLNSISHKPISYRRNSSSGNYEYFLYDSMSVRVTYNRPDASQGSREGFDMTDFLVTQDVDIIFNSPSLYYLYMERPEEELEVSGVLNYVDEVNTVLITTIQLDAIPKEDAFGNKMLNHSLYEPDIDVESDTTDITPLLSEEINKVIDYYNENELEIGELITVAVTLNDEVLDLDTEYNYNIPSRALYTHRIVKDGSYRVFIYYNNRLLNEMKQNILDRERLGVKL